MIAGETCKWAKICLVEAKNTLKCLSPSAAFLCRSLVPVNSHTFSNCRFFFSTAGDLLYTWSTSTCTSRFTKNPWVFNGYKRVGKNRPNSLATCFLAQGSILSSICVFSEKLCYVSVPHLHPADFVIHSLRRLLHLLSPFYLSPSSIPLQFCLLATPCCCWVRRNALPAPRTQNQPRPQKINNKTHFP